jgi:hypothetical protein
MCPQSTGGFEPLDELGRIHAQPAGELEQVAEVDVALAALDLAEERPVWTPTSSAIAS